MRVLALRGAHVVGTGRTLQKAQDACASVVGRTTPVALELSDFDSVVACAQSIRSLNSPIDMLICNAGMRGSKQREQVYGLEKHFVVNHLGHFILVQNLLERLYLAWQGRVVVVGSRAAYSDAPKEGIEFGNLRGTSNYSRSRAYGHSKLANVLFSLELARLLKGSRITSNALHPGIINTEIDRTEPRPFQWAFGVLTAIGGKSIEQGAATSCYVATSPLLGNVSGQYFEDCNAVNILGENHIHDIEQATKLWQVSEALTKDYLDEIETPDWEDFKNGIRRRTDS
jgi:NAD(P)-dependent dehydrogenase (short-subunit alcohol dehydrogenase family)